VAQLQHRLQINNSHKTVRLLPVQLSYYSSYNQLTITVNSTGIQLCKKVAP